MIFSMLAAFMGTIAFSVIFHVPKKEYLYAGAIGALGYGLYILTGKFLSDVPSVFLAVVFITLLARGLAVYRKVPTNVFLIPGIFTIAPGSMLYDTIYELISNQIIESATLGLETLKIVGAIVLGILIGLVIPVGVFRKLRKLG